MNNKITTSLLVILFAAIGSSSLRAQERSLAEFKKYVAGKTGGRMSEAQLTRLAKLVDVDGNGTISEAEFGKRMAAFRKVSREGVPPAKSEVRAEAKPEKNAAIARVAPLSASDQATVLLVTADSLAEAWRPFAKWKTACGKPTKIVTVNRIRETYSGPSVQEKIRKCVREHIERYGTRWVVLGGDSLPGGGGLVPGGHTTVHRAEPKGIPTDIVYLSPTNWDADGDGIYGEFRDDREAITYPDGSVGLGRIPVRTAEDVAAFTDKVIAYESRYPTTAFARNMIYTCTDRPAYPKVRRSWDDHVSKVWDGEMGRFFNDETPWDVEDQPGSYQLSANNLVSLFNKKTTSKLHIHGHGHLPSWVLERSRFSADHVGQLENDGAYPLITTVSCNTGEYDSETDPSIVERMIRAPKSGSVAVVAPIRTGKPHFAKRSDFRLMVSEGKLDGTTMTMTRYWSFGLGQGLTTGESFMKAKAAMVDDANKAAAYHLCVCELNLLGDPTLDMRARVPRTPHVRIERESHGSLEIRTDAEGCTICVWSGQDLYQVIKTNQTGDAFLTLPATKGEITLTISGADLNTVTHTLAPQR